MKGLKYSLDIFISTFCIENVFFSQTEIAGICLSGELMGEKDKNCIFADILISEILPQIHDSDVIHVNKQRVNVSFKSVIAMTALCFVGYSGYCSYNVYNIRHGSVDTSHAFLTEQISKYEDKVRSNMRYFPFKPALDDKYLFSENLFIKQQDSISVLSHGALLNIRRISCKLHHQESEN